MHSVGKNSSPRAVIFDLDDTLYAERQFVYSGFRAVARYLAGRYGLNEAELLLRMQQLLCDEGRGRIFNRVLQENGLDSSLVSTLVEIYRSHKPVLELCADAREIIGDLRGKAHCSEENSQDLQPKVMTGLITDGAAKVQWNKIKALGLEDMMDIIIVTDDYGIGCWKPSPVPYRIVMDKLGVLPQSCLYIGDNPEKDFVTARELGWYTVRIRRPGGMCYEIEKTPLYEADYDITDLLQIKNILHKLWDLII